jgi:hypothetical protein
MSLDAPAAEALDRFRAHVMTDESLQMALARCEAPEAFVAAALDVARGAGIALAAADFGAGLRPDPIGLFLQAPAPQAGKSWPGRDWLPIQVVGLPGGGLAVDWVHFAGAPLDDPFFATDARRAAALPFNRLFRYRIGLDHFIDGALDDVPAPDGFIFHMSRCGSTLVSQMLAALPGVVALAEPAPLDIVLKLAGEGVGAEARGGAPEAARGLAALRAMVAALGRRRSDADRHLVFKLDSWQALLLPVFRRAFASVPWIFLYRDPVEVAASLKLTPSVQMMAHVPHHHGIHAEADATTEDHIARVVAGICAAAADMAGDGGLLVNYQELPGAIGPILAHFGIPYGQAELATSQEIARRDAKSPWRDHVADSEAKQRDASPALRATVERHLAGPYRRLEALRLAKDS